MLIYNDLYEYDFTSCYYNLLKNIGWEMDDIDPNNKKQRNIKIGLLQKNNKYIGEYLQNTVENLIDFYINENNLDKKEILLRNKDGIITTRNIPINTKTMPLDLRKVITRLIFSSNDKKKWMTFYNDNTIIVKGISKRSYDSSYYDMFLQLNYSNRKNLFTGIDKIRYKILTGNNIGWYLLNEDDEHFSIPINHDDNTKSVIQIRKSLAKAFDINKINKKYIWDNYIWPFTISIMIEGD